MYAIIDFMVWAFVLEDQGKVDASNPENTNVTGSIASIETWETEDEATQYAEENLQAGLFRVIRVPDAGMGFKP